MEDKAARVPFNGQASNVFPIRPDALTEVGLCADEVAATVKSLERLIARFGFDSVVLNVAEALIYLRTNIEIKNFELPNEVEQRIVELEEQVRAINLNAATPHSKD
jgi:hypothetical protein